MARMISRLKHDERGLSLVFVGMGFMAFLAASMLAVDVGMLMTARSQAQNAADAGAHAGAVALAFDDYNNRSSSGPAVQSALQAATGSANDVMGSPVSITPGDVTFPNDPSGRPNWVRVSVFRAGGRSNPISTLMASIFGTTTADISATATGEASPANAVTCVKPFAVPDKWTERQTPAWDVNDTFSAFPTNPSVLPDIFRTVTSGTYTGYNPWTNRGLQMTLTIEATNTIKPSMYWAIQMPSGFQSSIASCDSDMMHFGDALVADPSATDNQTAAGISDLIAQDPSAYWDSAHQQVVSSHSPSPRVIVVPAYDPMYFDQGKQVMNFTQLRVSNFIGLFIEGLSGNNVQVRVVPIGGIIDRNASAAPSGSFPRAIRLVE